jgi:predicted metal-dependent peptidase
VEPQQKLTHARARLLLRLPFFGYLVTNLADIIDGERTRTASTDGRRIYWSPAFLERLELNDVVFVLAHEALHNALGHLWRRDKRSPRLWNLATDMAVNDALREAGLTTRLSGLFGAEQQSAERVYERVEKMANETGALPNPGWDDHGAWELSETEARSLDDLWRTHLSQASTFGKTPKDLALEVERRLYPKRDWRAELAEALRLPVDYRWTPPDRRFSQVVLPSLDGERRRVWVALDSSGSVSPEKLSAFFAELRAIVSVGSCEGKVLVCDAKIQAEADLAEFDAEGALTLKGGGGTSFCPVFAYAEEEALAGRAPDALVYLTDLVGEFPARAPLFRVLWAVQPEDAARAHPFGDVIVLED